MYRRPSHTLSKYMKLRIRPLFSPFIGMKLRIRPLFSPFIGMKLRIRPLLSSFMGLLAAGAFTLTTAGAVSFLTVAFTYNLVWS